MQATRSRWGATVWTAGVVAAGALVTAGCIAGAANRGTTDAASGATDAAAPEPFDGGTEDDGGPLPGTDASNGPASYPVEALDDVALVIVLGDSVAAGYDAQGNNGTGGRGYARLVVNNHADFPAYAGHDIATLYGAVDFRDLSESGATSAETLGTLQSALSGSLPASVAGDVLVLINTGGNDFNDDVTTMILPAATAAVAAAVRANLAEMFALLLARYEDPAAGKAVVFLVDTVHDTTDGTGAVPPQFDQDFCATLQSPWLTADLRALAIMNLGTLNAEIAAEVAAEPSAALVDTATAFIGHGMNAGADRLISDDCAHPTSAGHDLIRRTAWEALTGETW